MKYRCACLGLEGILENPAFAQHILQDIRYTVPGFGSDYALRTFDHGIEFTQCYCGDMGGLKPMGMAVHFSSDCEWTVSFDSVLDDTSVAHEYLVCPAGEAARRFPVRIICPDVLAQVQPGDALHGQAVAFIQQGTILKDNAEVDNTVAAEDDHAVRIAGEITCIDTHSFEFEDITRQYLELDIETDLGTISGVVLRENLNAQPQEGDRIVARAYVSLDVALPYEPSRRPFYEKPLYPALPGSSESTNYRCGYVPSSGSAMRILSRAIGQKDAFRFGRCCAEEVEFVDLSGEAQALDRWAIVARLNALLAGAKSAQSVLSVIRKADGSCFSDGIFIDKAYYLVLDTGKTGLVNRVIQLSQEEHSHDNDPERYLLGILANAMCRGQIEKLGDALSEDCAYRSDYSNQKEYGRRNVLGFIRGVCDNITELSAYRYELVPAGEEIAAEALGDLPGIYSGNWCYRLYQGKEDKLTSVVFLRYDANRKIHSILLSRNHLFLKSFRKAPGETAEETDYPPVDGLLQQKFGSEATLATMRRVGLAAADEEGAYVWQKADDFILDWFALNGYHLAESQLFDDCIGYTCTRSGEQYAVYVYAYGKRRTTMLDGDYCAKLHDHDLSKGRTILVIYLHVTAEKNEDGDTQFFVGMYGSKNRAPEVWELGWIGEQSSILFYPRKETIDLVGRLQAAYNAQRLDILKTLLADKAVLTGLGGGTSMNSGVYSSLAYLHREHGMMKTAYIRYNDVVYSQVLYLEEHCYVHFSVNEENRIDRIILEPLDENYRELIVTDEILLRHPADDVPALEKAEFLPASEASRFSMLLWFANGEQRRYDAPGEFDDGDVTTWLGTTFTDKIFRNGRIADPVPVKDERMFRSFPKNYPGVAFINGASISSVELYHSSYPVGEFKYRDGDEHVVLQDYDSEEPFAVGHIHNLDPSNPLYLFDKERKIAKTIPAQYQNTPIICYPFCGGYSEGLLMVSTMGELELQYHHNRYACAGMWGWLNTDLQTVIEPKYVYAMNFWNGRAIACKGEWTTVEKDGKLQYWCENEGWGVIDPQEREIVPCRFDALYEIEGTDRLYFVHEGGWKDGHYAIYDVQEQQTILELDFNFDMGYMFNECFLADGDILVFMDHLPGKGEDLVYAYDLQSKKFIAYAQSYTGRTLNGESKVVVNKDGQDIIVF